MRMCRRGLDTLWCLNRLARAVIKWTRTCDKRLARLSSYIHHTSDYGLQLNTANWVHSKTPILLVTLKNKNQPLGEFCVFFGSRTFVPISWMCTKQTSVSHISTESEIVSLDAGLRMDGLLALDLWDVVIEVLRSSKSTKSPTHGAAGNCL